jgi:hypothetical protein
MIFGSVELRPSLLNLRSLSFGTRYHAEPQGPNSMLEARPALSRDWKITVPLDLKTISCWKGISSAVFDAFPTNNDFVEPDGWTLLTIKATGEHAVRFMDENQGCCFWFAAWRDGDVHCRVYVSDWSKLYPKPKQLREDENFPSGEVTAREPQLTAGSLVSFFADYAKSGAEWDRDNLPLVEGVDKLTFADQDSGMRCTVCGDVSRFTLDAKGNLVYTCEDSSSSDAAAILDEKGDLVGTRSSSG